jgi:excisionase family DNA binding protein
MATTDDRLAIRHLEAARDRLMARGDAEAVSSLDAIIGRLEESNGEAAQEPALPSAQAASDLLTAREAAEILGIRSTGKVWQWVQQGKLRFETIGSQHRITRRSVIKLLGTPSLQKQQQFERELAEALAPFEGDEEDVEELLAWYRNGRRWPTGE